MSAAPRVEPESGLLTGVEYIPSPNCDERPAGQLPELVVVHGISLPPGEFGGPGVVDLFTNRLDPAAHPYYAAIAGLRVSAHLLIRRDGSLIQFVPFHRRAWHAGVSSFAGRSACNDFSVGIELEGTDDCPYEPAQLEQLAMVIRALAAAYPQIAPERVVGHCHVAPGRKTDPGPAFDWPQLHALLGGAAPDTLAAATPQSPEETRA